MGRFHAGPLTIDRVKGGTVYCATSQAFSKFLSQALRVFFHRRVERVLAAVLQLDPHTLPCSQFASAMPSFAFSKRTQFVKARAREIFCYCVWILMCGLFAEDLLVHCSLLTTGRAHTTRNVDKPVLFIATLHLKRECNPWCHRKPCRT